MFARLIAELPAVAEHKGFRKNVRKSEAALKRGASILPKAKFSLKRLFQSVPSAAPAGRRFNISPGAFVLIVGCALALICLGFGVANEYVRRHRTLYVANQFGPGLHLEISGLGPIRLQHGINEVSLPEGHYQARISGPIQEEVPFDIQAHYFDRWAGKPAWVLNPGGAAVIVFQTVTYSKTPQPARFNYHYGLRFERYPEITHPFTPLPQSITVDSSVAQKTLTSLQFFLGKPVNAVYALKEIKRESDAASLAEWGLQHDPENADLLEAYVGLPAETNELPRFEAFLRAGLTNRPVHIEWHRAYQQMASSGPNAAALPGLYENMLREDPTNSALLYLRGRICDDRARASDLFARAHQADPKNAFPIFALGFDQMLDGNWPAAKPLLSQAMALRPEDARFRAEWFLTCLALGQFDEAEAEMKSQLQRNPADLVSTLLLCQVMAAKGNRTEGEKAIGDLEKILRRDSPQNAALIGGLAESQFLYAVGDFKQLEQAGQATRRTAAGKTALFFSLIEQNRLNEASDISHPGEMKDPMMLLGMNLALQLAGKTNEAAPWRAALVESSAPATRAAGKPRTCSRAPPPPRRKRSRT